MSMRRTQLPVSVTLGIVMLIAGLGYPVTASALRETTPITVAAVRALGGGILLTLALPLLGSRLPRTRRLWLLAALIGFGNTTLTLVGISEATSRAGAAVAAVLLNTAPFFVALLGRMLLAERINALRAVGLVVGFTGVLAVVLSDPGDVATGSDLAIGFVLALLGALGWACGGLGMRALALRDAHLDIAGLTAAQFLCGGVALLALLPFEGGTTEWRDGSLAAALAFLVIGGQVIVYVGFNAALGSWPATRVYAWTFLVPAVAVVYEAARGNLPGGLAVAGIALVITGVAIVNHPRADSSAL